MINSTPISNFASESALLPKNSNSLYINTQFNLKQRKSLTVLLQDKNNETKRRSSQFGKIMFGSDVYKFIATTILLRFF